MEFGLFWCVCFFVNKPKKMKDERGDEKCSHTDNVGIQFSHSENLVGRRIHPYDQR